MFLKVVQRYILDCILNSQPIDSTAHGFVRGRNCGTGAKEHVRQKFLWNIDLENFFPTIANTSVQAAFQSMGYPREATIFLAGLCCLEGRLPQGAPTSPALSNIIFLPIDEVVRNCAAEARVTYTRYADDLSFSSNKPIPFAFQREIIEVLKLRGFALQTEKSRLMGPLTRREVTGLTINDKVSIPRRKRRQLRAFFHRIKLNPAEHNGQRDRAIGFASWIRDYHQAEGDRYMAIAKEIPKTG